MSSRAQALQLILATALAGVAAPAVHAQTSQLPPIPANQAAVMPVGQSDSARSAWEEARADWLTTCRQRFGGEAKGTGTVLGGIVGGIAGSAIAGRGNRTAGAVVGGVAGAVAGAAIGDSTDRRRASDYCESYLDRYMASYGQGYGAHGYLQGPVTYGYAMQPMMVMVPVAMVAVAAPAARQDCAETEIVEEWAPVSRSARRYIPRRVIPDKRVLAAPDKRVRSN